MTEYKFSELGIDEATLCLGLNHMNIQSRGYIINTENPDIFYYLGVQGNPDQPLPPKEEIIRCCDLSREETEIQIGLPKRIPEKTYSESGSNFFYTQGNCKTGYGISSGSSSLASFLPASSMQNMIQVNDSTFRNTIDQLKIYTYNLIDQNENKIWIGPTPQDWNNVFNFSNKNPNLNLLEYSDLIGVMLTCIKDLQNRVNQLESFNNSK